MNEEDLFVALVLGASVRLSALLHTAAASAGLETPLTLAVLILLVVLIAANHLGRKKGLD